MSEAVLETIGLTRRFGDRIAVDRLDLVVQAGEIHGFLGRNGAGKTTAIRMILNLIRPSGGEVRLWGERIGPGTAAVYRRVGFLVESASAYGHLTVRENLLIPQRLIGIPSDRVDRWIERLGLEPFRDQTAGTLSLGNFQRLSLARAFLHDPDLVILDEPTNGLDPAGVVEVRRLLLDLSRETGVTVFLSSHDLSEVSQIMDRITILHEGRRLETLDRAGLEELARPFLDVKTADPDRARVVLAGLGFDRIETRGVALRVYTTGDRAAPLSRALVTAGLDLEALVPGRDDLETVFLERTGGGR